MKKIISIFLVFFLFIGLAVAQKNELKIVFYNVENLFDTIDNPHKNDNEYLPSSKKEWNSRKYLKKIENISRVLISSDSVNLPAIVGMAEIENENVLKDLTCKTGLKKAKYSYVFRESSDPRGISVAIIYKTSVLKVLYSRNIRVISNNDDKEDEMREILYVKGIINKKDTLNIFVNHWKSRVGGAEKTEPKRILYAQALKKMTDSLFNKNSDARIIIMGDFNDNPDNSSISKYLDAQKLSAQLQSKTLYNVMMVKFLNGEGTLYYKSWDMFDQIIVSSNLFIPKKKFMHLNLSKCGVVKRSWMMYTDKNGLQTPNKTYGGSSYYGGYSDHLPVYITLTY
jgi:predicted extracellular nuclease